MSCQAFVTEEAGRNKANEQGVLFFEVEVTWKRAMIRQKDTPCWFQKKIIGSSSEKLKYKIRNLIIISEKIVIKQMCAKINTRKSSVSNDDYSLVANSNLVPSNTSIVTPTTSIVLPSPTAMWPITNKSLETRRMEIINNKYNNPQLTNDARNILLSKRLKNNTTKISLINAITTISQTEFSAIDPISFLSNMFISERYAVTTISFSARQSTKFKRESRFK
ncbi:hypothetical protein EDC94DRAFT_669160 [Helicostylum pulchrum]|nr:hypothetical protein EDC94DRAFT_669160 [Helicostylum pulchrum]